jgi:predicted DNA-binding transcriptional regulator YafY
MDKETGVVQRASAILADLIGNKVHDRHTISTQFGISVAAADRYIRQLQRVPGVVEGREGRRRFVRFDFGEAAPRPSYPVAVAACWAAGLADIFVGSAYEQGTRDALAYVTGRVKRSAEFKHVDRKFVFVARGGESSLPDSAERLDDLVDAVFRSRYAEIEYVHFGGREETARIRPLSMVINDHQLYVVGVPADGDRHLYRLSRIKSVNVINETFDYPDRANYDPKELFRDSFGIFIRGQGPPVRVRVLLSNRWRVHAQTHRWHVSQHVDEVPEGIVVTLTARLCWELRAWILGFGEEAMVIEPPELVEQIRESVSAMTTNYGVSEALLGKRVGPRNAQPSARAKRRRNTA